MRISDEGVALVKKHEGLRLKSYLCPAGKWTVGYGHTRTAQAGIEITEREADMLLRSDIEIAEACVNRQQLKLTQRQFDSLVCFVFNIGCKRFINSTLLKKIKENSALIEIEYQFKRWIYGGNGEGNGIDDDGDGLIDEPGELKKFQGMVNRRLEEWRLYAG